MNKVSIVFLTLCTALLIVLSLVFRGIWILPQSFPIGPLTVHYYGITMGMAVGAGWWLALKRANVYGLDEKQADALLLWVVIGGFLGARLYHVASSWQYYFQNPADTVKVWNGGLSIFGALIGGFAVLLLFRALSRVKYPLLSFLDWLAPSVLLGQIIGRFGNFFNYEAFGYPTALPWKMFVPAGFRPEGFFARAYYHPLFLYEALGNAVILVLLFWFHKQKKAGPPGTSRFAPLQGGLFFSYLFGYNTLRFFLEFLRVDSTFIHTSAGVIRLNSITSAILAVVGLVGFYVAQRAKDKT